MIQAQALIEKFNYALNDKWGYIWGKSGQTWTAAQQAKATREQTVKWGEKWVGRKVADCSGLFVWSFKQLGGSIAHGSNSIWKRYLSTRGTLTNGKRTDGQELRPGSAVFLTKGSDRHHIGLYIGGGRVIEAKGTYYGVIESKVSAWDEWGELAAVDYGATGTDTEKSSATATVAALSGSTVRLRPEPSTSKPAIALVPIGSTVEVGEDADGWTPVKWQGKSGYMMSKFLERG